MNKPNNNEAGYNMELKEMTAMLSEVTQFFTEYGRKVSKRDEHITQRLTLIDNHLNSAANEISEIVGIEFMENVFYK